MDDKFKIYIEQLRDGRVETINEDFNPVFLNVDAQELTFEGVVHVSGEAYIAGDTLLVHLNAEVTALLPCKICNTPSPVDIKIKDMYDDRPLEDVKSGIFHFNEPLREAVLLQMPEFIECNDGKCPQRDQIKKYLKKNGSDANEYQPFKDLN